MIKSDNLNELATALAKAQAEITFAAKDNKAHAYKYADLGTVIEAVKPALNKNGLSFAQLIEQSEAGVVTVTTLLLHTSGQYLGSTGSTAIPEMKGCNEAQRAGAAQSYLKRYQLQALTGLPTEDNDASSDGFVKAKATNTTAVTDSVSDAKAAGTGEAKKGGFGVKKPETVTAGTEDGWS